MNFTTKQVLQSELYNNKEYLKRLLLVLFDMTHQGLNQDVQKSFNDFYRDMANLLSSYSSHLSFDEFKELSTSLVQAQNYVEKIYSFIDSLISFTKLDSNFSVLFVDVMNLLYKFSFHLHMKIEQSTDLEVQYPRVQISTALNSDLYKVKKFSILCNDVDNFIENFDGTDLVGSIDYFRNLKYSKFISSGHQAVVDKNYHFALTQFLSALKIKPTAEAMTLVGWGYSFIDQYVKAKGYCLRAIKVDPEYGPAYNDYGSYLMSEGHFLESLKWFDKAKGATYYQNREYPYINSGRALLSLKQYEQAVEAFSVALELGPENTQLVDTLEQINLLIDKKYSQTINESIQ